MSKDDLNLRRLAAKHQEYEDRLAVLQQRLFLSEDERYEEATLKKLKLRVKDEIEAIRRNEARLAGRHG
ncbi:MAG TPA: hypothetical protein VM753_09885 [Anaeromyxobacter sp.]|nr:hypothetical protein [Anaeromyxobacter sp.]